MKKLLLFLAFLIPAFTFAADGTSFLQALDWQNLVNVLFTILVIAFPTIFLKFKGKIGDIKALVDTLEKAVSDGKLTKEEIGDIVQKIKDIF